MSDTWKQFNYFPSSVYRLDKPEFLEHVKSVAFEYLKETKEKIKANDIYPIYQTNNFASDTRLSDFTYYIAQTSWNILSSQGYKMETMETYVSELWLHHYLKTGSMDYHSHYNQTYVSGFYILECDDLTSEIVLHDPRPGKIQMSIQQEYDDIHNSTNMIFFKPEPGMLLFTNSWLPHSFTRNASEKPFSFIHFSISMRPYFPPPPPAEVI